uniref:Uncharacterized protein n=1 Tax=Anopheles coluzzii TaxID=1518534 RepID=A0A8W7PM84_ANOCL
MSIIESSASANTQTSSSLAQVFSTKSMIALTCDSGSKHPKIPSIRNHSPTLISPWQIVASDCKPQIFSSVTADSSCSTIASTGVPDFSLPPRPCSISSFTSINPRHCSLRFNITKTQVFGTDCDRYPFHWQNKQRISRKSSSCSCDTSIGSLNRIQVTDSEHGGVVSDPSDSAALHSAAENNLHYGLFL